LVYFYNTISKYKYLDILFILSAIIMIMILKDQLNYLIRDHDHIVEQLKLCSTTDINKFKACLHLNQLQMYRLLDSDISLDEKKEIRKILYPELI
jgi:hypothetical protein